MRASGSWRGSFGAFAIAASMAVTLGTASTAEAFCGFYVGSGDQQMFNDATQVVLMRMGTRTVLSMQNNYKGPPEAFAMVIPVPVVLRETDVKTLEKSVFEHVDKMGAPRLVEYWEADPCGPDPRIRTLAKPSVARDTRSTEGAGGPPKDFGVKIEAQFTVGEYQIVILSAKHSTGLDAWLKAEKYKIPDGAEPLLRPYVASGMKFFVAKVDPKKVKFGPDQRAALSPLRFHYDSEEFNLPIRLGLANSSGTQDLIVNILAPRQRFNVSNYKNVTIPTNIDVSPQMREKFASFYTALFDKTIEKNPGAVVTEYAWQATTCDPCPGPTLQPQELQTLGGDVLTGPREQPTAYHNADFVLTRLHARYGKDVTNDLVFAAAPPIVGGREHPAPGGSHGDKLEEGSSPSSINNFQGRYAIRHPWTKPITCDKPVRNRWGGPWTDDTGIPPRGGAPKAEPATNLAFAPRGEIDLTKVVHRDVPEIGIKSAIATPGATAIPTSEPAGSGSASAGSAASSNVASGAPATTPTTPAKSKSGCGCGASDSAGLLLGLGVLGRILRRRSRRLDRVRGAGR